MKNSWKGCKTINNQSINQLILCIHPAEVRVENENFIIIFSKFKRNIGPKQNLNMYDLFQSYTCIQTNHRIDLTLLSWHAHWRIYTCNFSHNTFKQKLKIFSTHDDSKIIRPWPNLNLTYVFLFRDVKDETVRYMIPYRYF
jgi:hypothetical protein